MSLKQRDMRDFQLVMHDKENLTHFHEEAYQALEDGTDENVALETLIDEYARSLNLCFTGKEYIENAKLP